MSDAANPTSTRARIGVLGAVFGLAFVVLAVHLWNVMVADHVTWSRRSVENRWAFHSVPARRGAIYDRSGALLAVDEATTELTLLYARFRLRHPVGAAVHGAIRWAGCLPGCPAWCWPTSPTPPSTPTCSPATAAATDRFVWT